MGSYGAVDNGDTNVTIHANNNTIVGIQGIDSITHTSALNLLSAATEPTDHMNVTFISTNNLYANSLANGMAVTCYLQDASSLFSGTGTVHNTITSHGGNLSDDNSCKSYFTKSTDHNNLTNLKNTLSALADNGGLVPTMALKSNSPAIDSGITLSSLTTDARGVHRPQGTAYDSGAYESPYSRTPADTLAGTGESEVVLLVIASLISLVGGFVLMRLCYSNA